MRNKAIAACITLMGALCVHGQAQDNRLELKAARRLVIEQRRLINTAIRHGMNLDQLSPVELSLLRADTTTLLSGLVPDEIAKAAADAAGPGMDVTNHVFIDCTNNVLTGWRLVGDQWQHAGFVDPTGRLKEEDAFLRASTRPGARQTITVLFPGNTPHIDSGTIRSAADSCWKDRRAARIVFSRRHAHQSSASRDNDRAGHSYDRKHLASRNQRRRSVPA
jgi:hypothetical protein